MKILHINDYYCNLGGAEKYLLSICKTQEEMGNEVIIISSSEKEHISINGRKEYFVTPSGGFRSGFRMWNIYRDIVKRENPDIIHLHNTHNANYFVSPFILKRLSSLKPTVKFVHDARFFCPNFGKKIIPYNNEICNYPVGLKCLSKKGCRMFHLNGKGDFYNLHRYFLINYELRVSKTFNRIIVGSRYMYNELVKNGFEENKIKKIPCFTDKSFGAGENGAEKNLILCVGGMSSEIKGVSHFIEVLNILRDKQWHAEIVGDGSYIKEMKKKVNKIGLEKRIQFVGMLSNEEINKYYQRCSMVVMPSMVPESFGLVGIEAMAFSKPVVAFDSGGIREWLINGETGFFVERGNVREMAKRVSLILDDDSTAVKMGKNGKIQVEKYYRKDLHLKELLNVYEEAIRSGAGTNIN